VKSNFKAQQKIMKKVSFLFIAFLLTGAVFAQVPPAFNYQAVARNNAGVALANQTIQVRLSVMQGASALYSETRSVTTNLLGLFNVQIGAAGATSTTGNFSTIQWLNNSPWLSLKVELDITNNNVFTDMGTQLLTSVPYSLAAETAKETKNLATRPLDVTTVPNTGDVLRWNGTAWTPFTLPAQPTVGNAAGLISTISAVSQVFVFAGPTATVTINGPQDVIIATATGSFGHSNNAPQACSIGLCWSAVAGGSPLTAFLPGFPDATVGAFPNKTVLTVTGTLTNLPAGTYKIGFGIKNKSSVNFGANDAMNMSYQVIRN
jgi:hypothetical protein